MKQTSINRPRLPLPVPMRGPYSTPSEGPPTRLGMVEGLKDWEDTANWADFFSTYWRLIYGVARKTGLNHAEAQDALQDTVIAVMKAIKNFEYDRKRCTFKSWLMLLTRQRIADQFRKRQKDIVPHALGEGEQMATVGRIPNLAEVSPESVWDEEWKKHMLAAALKRIKTQIHPTQFEMFELYALKQWPVKKVAATLHVSVSQVYVAKYRISKLLQTEIRRLEEQPPSGC